MIIAIVVLASVAFLLGVVILELAVDSKKRKAEALKKDEDNAATEPVEETAEETAENIEIVSEVFEEVGNSPVEEIEFAPVEEAESVEEVSEEKQIEDATENDSSDSEEEADDENDEVPELKAVVQDGVTRYIVIRYSKSFQAKLIQSSDVVKTYYSELKNVLLSYNGVKSRMSWKWETFRVGRKTLVKFRLRGKTLSLAYALNPDDFLDSKYLVESIADVISYADTPCLYRIKNNRRLNYAKELISLIMAQNGVNPVETTDKTDYAAKFPYETTDALIDRKLIKVLTNEEAQSGTMFKPSEVRTSVSVQEVDSILEDEVAAELIEDENGASDKTKTGIINIDTLSQYFLDGETVTLDEIKKRVKNFNKKTTYIKVLARGVLDKRLVVKADDFSLQAVKMIVLLGGRAIRK